MLKGDLASTPLPEVLRQLADGAATGCLHITDAADEAAQVYLRGGRVYAVVAPGSRPQLGARLVSSGALGPEALAEALEAQRTELQGWRLGELLVHLGYVDQPVVEGFVNEQVRASLSDLLPWRHATWKFRVNQKTREDVAPPVEVEALLAEIDSRLDVLAEIDAVVHGPESVPVLSAANTASAETEIDPDAWSLLCKVDGVRSVSELARECGFTMYEAGQVVFTLVEAGLLDIEESDRAPEVVDAAAFLSQAAAVEDLAPSEVAARLASALSGLDVPVQREEKPRGLELPADDEQISGSISRVSEALSALLGPATASDDVFGAPVRRPPAPAPEPVDPKRAERERRAAERRARDAEELAAAQAEIEAAKAAAEAQFEAEHGEDHVAEVVDLQSKRHAAEAEAARLEEERLAAEQARLAEEARLAEQERLAEEARLAEQERLAEEARLAEEERLAEAARLEEERLAAEAAEQERLAAEAAEQARLAEQERLAEEARLAEQERLAEEARLAEQERLAEEARLAEAARLEEERLAAEAAEQERLAEEARLAEQERLAADAAADTAADTAAEAATQFAALTADLDSYREAGPSISYLDTPASAFAELSAVSASAAEPRPAAAATPAPEPVEDKVEDEPMPLYAAPDTDTAALLRELSSLGLDDDPPPPPPSRPSRPTPPRPIAPPKKKKGLFGR